jgi:hypothetical protein
MLSRWGVAPVVTAVALALLTLLAPALLVPAQSASAEGAVTVTVVAEQGPVAGAFVALTGRRRSLRGDHRRAGQVGVAGRA